MTLSEYDMQINENRQKIVKYQTEIQDVENKINELNQLRSKVGNLDEMVKSTALRAYEDINSVTCVWGKIRAAINNSFFSATLGVIKGSEYIAAVNGLSNSIDRIDDEIRKLYGQIQQNRGSISKCQTNIVSLEENKNTLIQEQQKDG